MIFYLDKVTRPPSLYKPSLSVLQVLKAALSTNFSHFQIDLNRTPEIHVEEVIFLRLRLTLRPLYLLFGMLDHMCVLVYSRLSPQIQT